MQHFLLIFNERVFRLCCEAEVSVYEACIVRRCVQFISMKYNAEISPLHDSRSTQLALYDVQSLGSADFARGGSYEPSSLPEIGEDSYTLFGNSRNSSSLLDGSTAP